jgi:hypothetical protein
MESVWTEVADLNLIRYAMARGGAGIATDALCFGGEPNPPAPTNTGATEVWNGTSWFTVNSLNTSRGDLGGAGKSSSNALGFGGYGGGPVGTVASTESWNGSVWTETNDLNIARTGSNGVGTNSSALAAGGNAQPPITAATEEWNANFAYGVWATGGKFEYG